MSLATLLESSPVLVIDGALATELERHGADLNHALWSAKYLLLEPERIQYVHLDYLNAGARVIITASYQATVPGYLAAGFRQSQALRAITTSVEVAVAARNAWAASHPAAPYWPLIAGSVGPYGAFTADGGEYRGNYGLSQQALIDFHHPRIAALVAAGVDFIACETIPDLDEALAISKCIALFPGLTCWMSMSCRDGISTNAGQRIEDAAAILHERPEVIALGVNCTAPQYIPELVQHMKKGTTKPIVVYPNSGEAYDAVSKTWSGTVSCDDYVVAAATWAQAGARIIGGCCRTTPAHIRALVDFFAAEPIR